MNTSNKIFFKIISQFFHLVFSKIKKIPITLGLITFLLLNTLSCALHQTQKKEVSKPYFSVSEVLKTTNDQDWRTPNDDDLVYMKVKQGLIIFELASDLVPKTSENIKKIINKKLWDNEFIVRSHENYVVQWNIEDENVLKKYPQIQNTIPAEFSYKHNTHLSQKKMNPSFLPDTDTYAEKVGFYKGFSMGSNRIEDEFWLTHCYGAIGVGRGQDINSGIGNSLYVVIGHSPRHLDKNITVVGRVLYGMEHLTTLPRGQGQLGFYKNKDKYTRIKWIRLGSNTPKKYKKKIQVFKTDSLKFQDIIHAYRFKAHEWFHNKVGKLGLCNLRVPTKVE